MSAIRTSRRLTVCAAVALAGASCLFVAVLADSVGIGGQPGFGQKQYMLAALGAAQLLLAVGLFTHDRTAVSRGRRNGQRSVGSHAEAPHGAGLSASGQVVRERFRADLEGLRAVAVILVLLYHAKVPGFAGGYVGVDVFFVLSGFLITGLLMRELNATSSIDLAAFYARRLRRILPAAALALGVTVAVSAWLLPPLRVPEVAADGVAASLYASNLRFAFQATDYLHSEVDQSPLLHFWSLGVEEQFYLFWPALLLLAANRRRRFLRRVAILTVGVAGSSFLFSAYLTRTNAPWAFFSLPPRVWELGIGALLAMAASRVARLPAVGAAAAGWAGITMVVLSGVALTSGTPFPGLAALLPTCGAAFVIAGGIREPLAAPARILGNRLFRFFGRISYSLYLWHWPILVLPVAALERELSLPLRAILALATIPIAAASQRWIEDPIRRGRLVGTIPRWNLACAAIVTLALAGFSFGTGRLSAASVADRELPRVYDDGCHLAFGRTQSGTCAYGELRSTTKVILFGDSHAAQWFPALELLADQNNWRLISLTKSACPSVDIPVYNTALKRAYKECDVWRESVFARIATEQPALVVLANSRGHSMLIDGSVTDVHSDEAAWGVALRRTIMRIAQSAGAVVVVGDTPRSAVDSPVCLSRHVADPEACATSRAEALDPGHMAVERAAALATGATFVDPTGWVCPSDPCPPVIAGTPVYRDDHHLTLRFSRSLAPLLASAFPVP